MIDREKGAMVTVGGDTNFQFVSGDAYIHLPVDPTPWVIEGFVPVGGLVNLFGRPKTGKSFLALQMASNVSDPTKPDVLGMEIKKHGRVAYMQIDTPRTIWNGRIKDLQSVGYSFKDVYFVDSLLVPKYPFNILEPEINQWLQAQLHTIKPVMLVVDTLREIHQKNENDSTDMQNVISHAVKCAMGIGASIVFVSHQRKGLSLHNGGGESGDITDDNRGSGYVAGRMDTIAKLTEKTLAMKGRAKLLTTVSVQQNDVGCVELHDSKLENDTLIGAIFKANPGMKLADAAKKLAGELEITEQAAVKRIQRWKKTQKS